MVRYNSPNLTISKLLQAFFIRNSDDRIINFFKEYTGKKYILIVGSARTGLYLTYKSIGENKEIITTPMTCSAAIEPILYSKNIPYFVDVNPSNFLMDENKIEKAINNKTVAIQAIHLGGFPYDLEKVKKTAEKYSLLLVEDCAQGFGSDYNGIKSGVVGDISCFSFIKNLYGIGGGIIATDNFELFSKISDLNNQLKRPSITLIIYRIIRALLETCNGLFYRILYKYLMGIRTSVKNNYSKDQDDFNTHLNKVSKIEKKIFCVQLNSLNKLHKIRKEQVGKYLSMLVNENILDKNTNIYLENGSYVKLYFISHDKTSTDVLKNLNEHKIEAKHLEHKFSSYLQQCFSEKYSYLESINSCTIYKEIHDKIFTLPLREDLKISDIENIIHVLKEIGVKKVGIQN